MDLSRAASSFTPEQLQFIGALAVFGAIPFIGFVWRVAVWKTRLETDVDNLGALMGTEKGLAIQAAKEKKLKKEIIETVNKGDKE